MINKICNWFMKQGTVKVIKASDFRSQSESALSVFRATLEQLKIVNKEIMDQSAKLQEEVMKLELERDQMIDISMENTKIMKNIDKILN